MARKYILVLVLVLIGAGAAAFFYFSKAPSEQKILTLKGSLQQISADKSLLSILADSKEWTLRLSSETKILDKEQMPLEIDWLGKGWEIQVTGAQAGSGTINASEIIIFESINLPEEIRGHESFNAWLLNWQSLWPQLSAEDFKKTASHPIMPTEISSDESQLASIPGYEAGKIFSPDKQKYINYLFYWGEPDSAAIIFNRQDQNKLEQIAFCGTPCTFEGAFWITNSTVVLSEVSEDMSLQCGQTCPDVLKINVFDLAAQNVQVYETKKSKDLLRQNLLNVRCEAFAPCLQEFAFYENKTFAAPLEIKLR
ncbi:MAG: hypothetical protein ACYS1A_19175, partial [Planctomycetota bacterium]